MAPPCPFANQEPWWGLLDPYEEPDLLEVAVSLIPYHLSSCHRLVGPVSTDRMPERFTPFSGLMLPKPSWTGERVVCPTPWITNCCVDSKGLCEMLKEKGTL